MASDQDQSGATIPQRVLVTGAAGFIGFHLVRLLLAEGIVVHGFDGMTNYYAVNLKRRRYQILLQTPNYSATEAMLEDGDAFGRAAVAFAPDVIVHLAAQAGVRRSLENLRAYIDSNIVGTFQVMEAARELNLAHLLMALTSSVYRGNEAMPFTEIDNADEQLTIYAATKRRTKAWRTAMRICGTPQQRSSAFSRSVAVRDGRILHCSNSSMRSSMEGRSTSIIMAKCIAILRMSPTR